MRIENIPLFICCEQCPFRAIPPHRRGAYASSRYVECGLRWTRGARAREVLQGGLRLGLGAVSNRSAQDERRYCVRQKRVVLAPVAGVKLAEAVRIQPDSLGRQSGSDGGKRNSSPGRARHKPSNHCAGNAGVLRLYLYARVRTLLHIAHETAGAASTRHSLLPLSGGTTLCKPRAFLEPRERMFMFRFRQGIRG